VEYENEEIDRITVQIKGGIKESSGTFRIGDTVTMLLEARVTSIEYKENQRTGHLTRHHTLVYDKAEAVRKHHDG
jgi:hypothetical protein